MRPESSTPRAAVYAIRCGVSGKVYVGSAVDVRERWRVHRKLLRHGRHPNGHLQAAWCLYGADAFAWEVLESVYDTSALIATEQRWIDTLCATSPDCGYNLRPIAGSNLGLRFSEESRARVSAARKGNTNALGFKQSAETIERRRTRLVGQKRSAPNGWGWTPERRQAQAERMLSTTRARGSRRSEEFKAKVSVGMRRYRAMQRGEDVTTT